MQRKQPKKQGSGPKPLRACHSRNKAKPNQVLGDDGCSGKHTMERSFVKHNGKAQARHTQSSVGKEEADEMLRNSDRNEKRLHWDRPGQSISLEILPNARRLMKKDPKAEEHVIKVCQL